MQYQTIIMCNSVSGSAHGPCTCYALPFRTHLDGRMAHVILYRRDAEHSLRVHPVKREHD